jgi:hypothetical protein
MGIVYEHSVLVHGYRVLVHSVLVYSVLVYSVLVYGVYYTCMPLAFATYAGSVSLPVTSAK